MYIRALVKDDINQIIDFLLDPNELTWSEKALEIALEGVLNGAYLANVGLDATSGQVVAYAVASYAADQADVQHIVVNQSFRRQSLGRKLLQALIKGLVERGVKTVFLEVRSSNQVAINLYQSMGFECLQKRQDYYPRVDGMREDAWVFKLACL